MTKEPRDKQQHSDEAGQPAKQHHGSTAEETAALNETLKTFSKKYYEPDETKERRERIRFRIEIGIAIGVAFNIALTGGLLVAGAIQANYSGQQVAASQEQVRIMTDTEHRQLRAYVGLIPKDVENFGDPNKQTFRFIRKNYGTTPAYDLIVTEFGQSVAGPSKPIVIPQFSGQPPEILRGNVTLFPTGELEMKFIGLMVPKEQVDHVLGADDWTFSYLGQVKYRDAFDQTHFTNFCWTYKRNQMTADHVEWCGLHNDSN